MNILDVEQGSAEWHLARTGLVTGSKMADVLAVLKRGGESAARFNYRIQIVTEILTGQPVWDGYLSPEMQWGTDNEPFARAAYEMEEDTSVDQVGMVLHESIPRMGGSPDGLISDDGGVEIKCPKTTTHVKWMLAGTIPEEHEAQMLFYLSCTGRKWWDFVSFDPRLPKALQLFTIRMGRDEERIAAVEAAVVQFNAEVDQMIEKLKALCGSDFTIPERKPVESEFGITDEEIRSIYPAFNA